MDKETLRKKMELKLRLQTKKERRKNSSIIHKKLFSLKEFLDSKCIMVYVSKGTKEVETGPVIKKAFSLGKKVVLPVTLVRENRIRPVRLENFKQGLKKGPYGIYQPEGPKSSRPIKAKDIDLIIVPGLAFDNKNNRLGHGKGYYDSFLKNLPDEMPKIGLGFRFQMLESIPATKKDFSLTSVITN